MGEPDRLFALDGIPEVPLFREPRRSRGEHDARFRNNYPPDWHRCSTCDGHGALERPVIVPAHHPGCIGNCAEYGCPIPEEVLELEQCPNCLGMGSLKARVRLEAGHRCVRCLHPYIPKGDAKMLGVEPTPFRWSPCDAECTHRGPLRITDDLGAVYEDRDLDAGPMVLRGWKAEAEWRILTVHHLDGDKANCRWWNLAALCQRCHLEIQAKVVMERVYPYEHSSWFRPYVCGYYAFVYEGREITREEAVERADELLALELSTA